MNNKIKIKSIEGIAGYVEFLERRKNDALFLLEIPDIKTKTTSILYPDDNPKHLFFFRDGLPTLFSPEEKDLKMLIEMAGTTPKQRKRKSRKEINPDILHQVIIKQKTSNPILKYACAKSGKLINNKTENIKSNIEICLCEVRKVDNYGFGYDSYYGY